MIIIPARDIEVGDCIRVETADGIQHELVVGEISHRSYLIKPDRMRSLTPLTYIELAATDAVQLIKRAQG